MGLDDWEGEIVFGGEKENGGKGVGVALLGGGWRVYEMRSSKHRMWNDDTRE